MFVGAGGHHHVEAAHAFIAADGVADDRGIGVRSDAAWRVARVVDFRRGLQEGFGLSAIFSA